VIITQNLDEFRSEGYTAETGTKVNKAYAPHPSWKTVQIDWARSKGYQEGLVILDGSNAILYGEERVCWIPDGVEWTEQAQIGDTHLVIMSPTHGVIIMKAPQDVHSFGSEFTSPEVVPAQIRYDLDS